MISLFWLPGSGLGIRLWLGMGKDCRTVDNFDSVM